MPGLTVVDRALAARDDPPDVGGGSGDGDRGAEWERSPVHRARDGDGGRGCVHGGMCCRQARHECGRLDPHVSQHVNCGLLHGRIDRCALVCLVVVIEAVRPLHGPGAPDQAAAGGSIHGHIVSRGACRICLAVVAEELWNGDGRGGEPDGSRRPEAVVLVTIELVPEATRGQVVYLPWTQLSHGGSAPESKRRIVVGDCHGVVELVNGQNDSKELTGELILWLPTSDGRWGKAGICPRSRPLRGRVDLGIGQGPLVTDHSAVRGVVSIDGRLEPNSPEVLVP